MADPDIFQQAAKIVKIPTPDQAVLAAIKVVHDIATPVVAAGEATGRAIVGGAEGVVREVTSGKTPEQIAEEALQRGGEAVGGVVEPVVQDVSERIRQITTPPQIVTREVTPPPAPGGGAVPFQVKRVDVPATVGKTLLGYAETVAPVAPAVISAIPGGAPIGVAVREAAAISQLEPPSDVSKSLRILSIENQLRTETDPSKALALQQEAMQYKSELTGGIKQEQLLTTPIYEVAHGGAEWWRENVNTRLEEFSAKLPPIPSMTGRDPFRLTTPKEQMSAVIGLASIPGEVLEFGGMVFPGAETLLRNPITFPALATAGLVMQIQGIGEGLGGPDPTKFVYQQAGTIVAFHGIGKFTKAASPVGADILEVSAYEKGGTPTTFYAAYTKTPFAAAGRDPLFKAGVATTPEAMRLFAGAPTKILKDISFKVSPSMETSIDPWRNIHHAVFDKYLLENLSPKEVKILETTGPAVNAAYSRLFTPEQREVFGEVPTTSASRLTVERILSAWEEGGVKEVKGPWIRSISTSDYSSPGFEIKNIKDLIYTSVFPKEVRFTDISTVKSPKDILSLTKSQKPTTFYHASQSTHFIDILENRGVATIKPRSENAMFFAPGRVYEEFLGWESSIIKISTIPTTSGRFFDAVRLARSYQGPVIGRPFNKAVSLLEKGKMYPGIRPAANRPYPGYGLEREYIIPSGSKLYAKEFGFIRGPLGERIPYAEVSFSRPAIVGYNYYINWGKISSKIRASMGGIFKDVGKDRIIIGGSRAQRAWTGEGGRYGSMFDSDFDSYAENINAVNRLYSAALESTKLEFPKVETTTGTHPATSPSIGKAQASIVTSSGKEFIHIKPIDVYSYMKELPPVKMKAIGGSEVFGMNPRLLFKRATAGIFSEIIQKRPGEKPKLIIGRPKDIVAAYSLSRSFAETLYRPQFIDAASIITRARVSRAVALEEYSLALKDYIPTLQEATRVKVESMFSEMKRDWLKGVEREPSPVIDLLTGRGLMAPMHGGTEEAMLFPGSRRVVGRAPTFMQELSLAEKEIDIRGIISRERQYPTRMVAEAGRYPYIVPSRLPRVYPVIGRYPVKMYPTLDYTGKYPIKYPTVSYPSVGTYPEISITGYPTGEYPPEYPIYPVYPPPPPPPQPPYPIYPPPPPPPPPIYPPGYPPTTPPEYPPIYPPIQPPIRPPGAPPWRTTRRYPPPPELTYIIPRKKKYGKKKEARRAEEWYIWHETPSLASVFGLGVSMPWASAKEIASMHFTYPGPGKPRKIPAYFSERPRF